MEKKLRRFYKSDEDDEFVKVECVNDGSYVLKSLSKNGYWLQKSTCKRFYRNAVITEFPDGTTNEEDYEWIES